MECKEARISENASGRDEANSDVVSWSFPVGYRASVGAGWQHPSGWGIDAAWTQANLGGTFQFPTLWLRWDPSNNPWGS